MQDSAVLPWYLVTVGIVVAMGGAILAMSGWGQRQTRLADIVGRWIVGAGLCLALGVTGINGLVYIANGIGIVMHQTFAAAARPQVPTE